MELHHIPGMLAIEQKKQTEKEELLEESLIAAQPKDGEVEVEVKELKEKDRLRIRKKKERERRKRGDARERRKHQRSASLKSVDFMMMPTPKMGMRAELETAASIIDKEGHDSSRESKETPWDKKFYVLYTLAVREQKVGKLYGTLPTLFFFY